MAEEFNSIAVPVTQHFLKKSEVLFTKRSVKGKLENNPYYPSLFSISHLLAQYNIENRALEVDKAKLNELPIPFFAFFKIDHGEKDFITVTSTSGKKVHYFDGQEKVLPKEEFLLRWSGVVLLAQPNEKSREKDYKKNRSNENKKGFSRLAISVGFLFLLVYSVRVILKGIEFQSSSFLLLVYMFSGLITSVLLLIHEIDGENVFIKNICTGGEKTNCSAVLNSKGSKIWGISWSEVGFFYFSAMVLYLLLPGMSFEEKRSIITYTLLFSSVYIPFSILYQLFAVKQWCRLCLIIQLILLTGLAWVAVAGNFQLTVTFNGLLSASIAIALPVSIWYALKPILIKAQSSDKFSAAYKRLYSHPEVFKVVVAGEPMAPNGWENLGGIEKGNPNAENVILKICSPSCGHCNKAHKLFNELLVEHDNLKIITLYHVYHETNIFEKLELPVRHFLAMKALGKDTDLQNAMDYWYLTPDRTYEELKRLYPVPEEILEQQFEKIKAMSDWCTEAEISYTPTVYLNGHKLPSTFQLTDLKYILS
jgi:uncharacterized membrane protein